MVRRKITVTDWLRGAGQSIRSGTGMNPLTTQRLVNAAHDERKAREERYPTPSREDGYYSKIRRNGTIDVFIGQNGDITSERPHVHIVHSSPENRIVFTVTDSNGGHSHQEYLPSTASGNDVNRVVDRLRTQLR